MNSPCEITSKVSATPWAMKALFAAVAAAALPTTATAVTNAPTWSDITAGAATGYCLAHHPYQTIHTGPYTPDGFEIVASPGVVGAVRRNFVYDRQSLTDGNANTCSDACAEFGHAYAPSYIGVALRQQIYGGGVITSGIGDMAATAAPDTDPYSGQRVIAGAWSRGNSWHESDVASADYCCCQVVPRR